jgi:hypothetical protein
LNSIDGLSLTFLQKTSNGHLDEDALAQIVNGR